MHGKSLTKKDGWRWRKGKLELRIENLELPRGTKKISEFKFLEFCSLGGKSHGVKIGGDISNSKNRCRMKGQENET